MNTFKQILIQNPQAKTEYGFFSLRKKPRLNSGKIAGIIVFLLLGLFSLDAQKIVVDKEVRMLALGDSYTIGASVAERVRWPHQFIDALRARGFTGNYPDYIAKSGWTTKNLLQGIDANLNENIGYNLVSILIGVNNQYQGVPINSYSPDLREIIDIALKLVQNNKSKVFILSIPDYAYTPFGNGNTSISNGIDEYNRIKRSIASEYGIAFIDITPISREGLNDPSLVAIDGLHPSAVQYGKWVKEIIPLLEIDPLSTDIKLSDSREDLLMINPNPTVSYVKIEALKNINRIRIFDALGKIVFDQALNTMSVQLDLSSFAPGFYFV
ncbi:MAG: T9SS type A sorting domain-containing protein, partial [Bacteroidetes bacterium]|nr:T9SS type A sorting domain-containing protein [Bacteroidota bacterium]